MKFVTYIYDGQQTIGVVKDDKLISMKNMFRYIGETPPNDMLDLIENYGESVISKIKNIVNSTAYIETLNVEDVKILPPIPYPRRNIFCLGKNYADHVAEIPIKEIANNEVPKCPIYFTKVASPSIGDNDFIEFSTKVTKRVDYEVELAIIIGKEGKDIKSEDAYDYIFGYTIVNDVSARDLQGNHIQWFKAKSLDTFTPMGPYVIHKSEVDFPPKLDIKCFVNGELRQHSSTDQMIFDIPYIISDLSKGLTLKKGDIICTGTPSGVGMGFDPMKLLNNNDEVKCYIEKIGYLNNKVKVVE